MVTIRTKEGVIDARLIVACTNCGMVLTLDPGPVPEACPDCAVDALESKGAGSLPTRDIYPPNPRRDHLE